MTFTKHNGTFAESGTNTVKLTGLRASAHIVKAGNASLGELNLRLWGMTLSKMNDLSTLGLRFDLGGLGVFNNSVLVEAGDDDAGMSVVFYGTIYAAWVDFAEMPDVAFHLTAYIGAWEAMAPVPPTSYAGLADVATIMSGLATLAGLNFNNNGVTDKFLMDPYLPGTALEQINRVAVHAGINFDIDGGGPRKTLTIWPEGGSRGGLIPLISRDTDMIVYPAYTRSGIVVTTVYNPSIQFGGRVKIVTDLASANASGEWIVMILTHTLEAEVPHGAWRTRFEAISPAVHAVPQVRPA